MLGLARSRIIPGMQSLRNAHQLARIVLAWFVLTLGVAVASPAVHPQAMELICSDAGVYKLVVRGGAEGGLVKSHTLECPLCVMGGGAPLVMTGPVLPKAFPVAERVQALVSAPVAVYRAAPPPARAPPIAT